MKTTLLLNILFVLITTFAVGQKTMNSTGNWSDATKWVDSEIADAITEDAIISANVNSTLLGVDNYTVGNVTLVQDNTLTINNDGQLTLGASGNLKTLTTNSNATLDIKGFITIWGDLIANSNINISVTSGGKLTIHGKLKFNGTANITMAGGSSIEIYGNFDGGGGDNIVNLNGNNTVILVHGNVLVDGASTLSPGSGSFQYGGTCNDGSSNFCDNAIFNPALPVELLSFTGYVDNGKPKLLWVTASEKNNDRFVISRFKNEEIFEVAQVQGSGTSVRLIKYEWTDETSNLSGKLYYQLSQVDYDGKKETFKTIMINMNTKLVEGFSIGNDEEVISLLIFDELGRPTTAETGLRIIRLQTNIKVYIRKEYVQHNN